MREYVREVEKSWEVERVSQKGFKNIQTNKKKKQKTKNKHLPALFFAISIAKWSDGDPLAVGASIGYLNVYNISNGICKSYLIHTCNGFNCHVYKRQREEKREKENSNSTTTTKTKEWERRKKKKNKQTSKHTEHWR